VKATMEGDISPAVPASILRTHPNATLYLDRDAAAGLNPEARGPILQDDAA
jgi:glucosamine-6-phosphate deaminase